MTLLRMTMAQVMPKPSTGLESGQMATWASWMAMIKKDSLHIGNLNSSRLFNQVVPHGEATGGISVRYDLLIFGCDEIFNDM